MTNLLDKPFFLSKLLEYGSIRLKSPTFFKGVGILNTEAKGESGPINTFINGIIMWIPRE